MCKEEDLRLRRGEIMDNGWVPPEIMEDRATRGVCCRCEGELFQDNPTYCEEHWFKSRAARHLGNPEKGPELKALWDAQNGQCAYTGWELKAGTNASLDHILPQAKRPTLVHEITNVEWVHCAVNAAKADMMPSEFISFCQLVVEHKGEKTPTPQRKAIDLNTGKCA